MTRPDESIQKYRPSAASVEDEDLDSSSLSELDGEVSEADESSSDDEMANKQANVNPPSFIGPEKSFSQYKKDVKLWSRLTTVKPELQAELIVYTLDGHKSGIKEKIQTQIGDSQQGNADGVDDLLKFLEKILLELQL